MTRGSQCHVLVLLVWLLAFLGAGISASQEMKSSPDPLARDSSPLRTGLVIGALIVVAAGAVWLGQRYSQAPPEEPASKRPQIALATSERTPRRKPDLYEELKRHEAALEDFEEAGTDRHRRRVVRLVTDEDRPEEKEH